MSVDASCARVRARALRKGVLRCNDRKNQTQAWYGCSFRRIRPALNLPLLAELLHPGPGHRPAHSTRQGRQQTLRMSVARRIP